MAANTNLQTYLEDARSQRPAGFQLQAWTALNKRRKFRGTNTKCSKMTTHEVPVLARIHGRSYRCRSQMGLAGTTRLTCPSAAQPQEYLESLLNHCCCYLLPHSCQFVSHRRTRLDLFLVSIVHQGAFGCMPNIRKSIRGG